MMDIAGAAGFVADSAEAATMLQDAPPSEVARCFEAKVRAVTRPNALLQVALGDGASRFTACAGGSCFVARRRLNMCRHDDHTRPRSLRKGRAILLRVLVQGLVGGLRAAVVMAKKARTGRQLR